MLGLIVVQTYILAVAIMTVITCICVDIALRNSSDHLVEMSANEGSSTYHGISYCCLPLVAIVDIGQFCPGTKQ